jgi:AcrR family transcriptional regulator
LNDTLAALMDDLAQSLKPLRRTQAERRAQSERGMLIAAAEILVEQGYNAATFDRITERAGYSRGLVTQRFGSKDGLMEAVIAWLSARLEKAWRTRLESARSGRAKLVDYMDVFLSGIESDRIGSAYYVLLSAALANLLPQRELFLKRHEEVRQKLIACIREGMADGTIRPVEDVEVAATVLGCFELGAAVQHQLDPGMDIAALRAFVRSKAQSS